MNGWLIALLVILGVILVGFIVLAIVGNKMQKKNAAAQADLRANAQTTSMLVIDKKRMKLKDAGFPQIVIDQTPKYARGTKVPVVKAKIGPQIHSLMCDEKIFDLVPVKKEVKAMISGIYIVDVKGLRGALQKEEKPKKKKWFSKKKEK
ncbi:MAG: hypothetical protein Q4C48_05890 [Lachnospiraceae bacterium]|nr:hypothetical protein [Lachnospiraceae bacterium]